MQPCGLARLRPCTLPFLRLRACALARLCACALVRLHACLRVFALTAIRAASLALSLLAFGQFYAPVLTKIGGEWGSNSRPKDYEIYALPTALSPPCSQSRFADVDLPRWDMPAEHFVDDTFSVADGGTSFAKNAKSKLTPYNRKAAKRLRRSSQGSLPSRPAPSPTFSRRADQSLPRLENIEMVVWPSANIDNRDPYARLNRGRPFRGLLSCTASLSSVTSVLVVKCAASWLVPRRTRKSHLHRSGGLQGFVTEG